MKVDRLDGTKASLTKDAVQRIKASAYQRGAFGVYVPKSAMGYQFELEAYRKGIEDAARIAIIPVDNSTPQDQD